MSADVYSDIEIAGHFEPEEIIKSLIDEGWKVISGGKATYLPVGDDDMFDCRVLFLLDTAFLLQFGILAALSFLSSGFGESQPVIPDILIFLSSTV